MRAFQVASTMRSRLLPTFPTMRSRLLPTTMRSGELALPQTSRRHQASQDALRSGMPIMSIESLVDMAALGLAAVLALQCVGRLDHRPPRSSTSGYEKKLRPLAEKLRGRLKMGPDGKPIKLSLREHELEVAADVVAPNDIDVTIADVGGLEKVATQLQMAILSLQRPEIYQQSKLLRAPRGILLHGPPGTGKTMLARTIAKETSFTFIALNPARLLSKWYGHLASPRRS